MAPELKEKCVELRRRGFTITEIMEALNLPKTTVYDHIRDIPKNKILLKKLEMVQKRATLILRQYCPVVKGKSWKGRSCREIKVFSPDLVNLIAHSIFDGEIKHGAVVYHNRSVVLIDNFKEKMKIVYDFEPIFYEKDGVKRISYYSVELSNYFEDQSRVLLKIISTLPVEHHRKFLKAFFDDEGCVRYVRKTRTVKGYQYNDKILFLIQRLLKNFNIESKVDPRFHEIIISRRDNLIKFAKEINFTSGLCVNGKRSNSVWKKNLEKREILKRAIDSYSSTYTRYYARYR